MTVVILRESTGFEILKATAVWIINAKAQHVVVMREWEVVRLKHDTTYTIRSCFSAFGDTPHAFGNFRYVTEALDWLAEHADEYPGIRSGSKAARLKR